MAAEAAVNTATAISVASRYFLDPPTGGRERETERQRDRERDRQTDRQTD